MPFVATIRFYPVPGKVTEMRALAEARTKALQAAGLETQLSTCTWGPEYPYLLMAQRYATLADYENAAPARVGAAQQFNPQMGALARQTGMPALNERLQTGMVVRGAKWQHSQQYLPATGRQGELRSLLIERGKQMEAVGGGATTLLVQVAGPISGALTRVSTYASLAAFEERRAKFATDPGQAEFFRKSGDLMSRPAETTIREIIIPYA